MIPPIPPKILSITRPNWAAASSDNLKKFLVAAAPASDLRYSSKDLSLVFKKFT